MEEPVKSDKNYSILVTGGSGFLGQAIIKELLVDTPLISAKEIRILDVKEYSDTNEPGITYIHGDVRDYESVDKASRGVDIIFHAAAIVDWGTHSANEVYDVNFTGTENVPNFNL